MKNYELAYLANPDLSEEEVDSLSKKITDFVVSEGGSVIKVHKPEKRRLGYEIDKKKEGFLVSIEVSLEANKAIVLKKMVGEEKSILRDLLVIKPEEKIYPEETPELKEVKTKKADLENIDEKIDEILK
jgi:small subunit ribosomal protein S6